MKEVLPLISDYGFNQLKLNRIEGFVETDNMNCKNAMSKLDFINEGTIRDCEIKNGKSISIDVYAKINYKHKNEHKALVMFLSGKRVNDIVNLLRKCEIHFDEVRGWFYGDEEMEGFIPAMFEKFLKMNRYCPFCNTGSLGGPDSLYPLNGTVCPHKEFEWSEEEG